ncbi:MAG: hypothetical protein K8I00_00985 [Candidatus Omnitrophica bacterium]|nr:hypothetical protein [Candidatus Omnitrophota bacterium]
MVNREERFIRKESDKVMFARVGGCLFGTIQIGLFIIFTLLAFTVHLKSGIADRYKQGYVGVETQILRGILFTIPVLILIGPYLIQRVLRKRPKK